MNNDSTILNINHDEEKPSNLKVLLKKCELVDGNETENDDNVNCNTSICDDDHASTATASTSSEQHIK